MNTPRSLRLLLPVLAMAGILSASLPRQALAETITVSPPKFELFGNPGDIITEKLKVSNDSPNEVTYQTEVEDFQAAGDQGGINIIDDPNAPRSTFSLEKWMTVEPSRFTVGPGEDKVVNMVIRIPKNGEPGGHYASVQIKLAGQPVSGGASVETRLNSLVLLRVSGNLDEQLQLETFKTERNYYQNGPIDFVLKSKNTGNVHLAPTGTIMVTDMFGRKVEEIPLNAANVLPGASRSVKTTWEDKGMVGRYRATLVATYGQGQKQNMTAETSFYVIPPVLIWIVAAIAIIAFLFLTQRKKLKRIINRLTSD